ncbi:MAG: hypothetical protein DRI56_13590, partial [Chloroflexota bacterium]
MLTGNESLFVSLLILSLVRFGGVLVSLDLSYQKREEKYLLLIVGWLYGCAGPLLGIATLFDIHPDISNYLWSLFSLLAGSSTILIIFGILSYFWEFRGNYIIFGSVAFICVMMLLKFVLAVDISNIFSLFVQASFLIFLIVVAIFQWKLLLRIARSSFYWMAGIAIVGVVHTLGFIFIYQNQVFGFVGTTFLAVLTIIFILHLEYDLSFGKLKQSEEKYRNLFTQIADPVFVFDKESHHFIDCNQSALDRYGYTLEELCNMSPQQLHPHEEYDEVDKNINDEEDTRSHTYTHLTKRGERIQVEVSTMPVKYEGQEAWLSIVHDITELIRAEKEKHQMETQLRQAQKLESIGTLASGVAHEINNPIMGIMNYAQ